MIKVVLWDVDGTLLDFKAAEKAAIKKLFSRFGLGVCTDEMISEYSQINVRYWKMLERGEMTKPQILTGRFREFFSLYGLDTGVAEAFNDEYQVRLGDTICFHDGALETVGALRGRVLQCAVTNGTKIAQDRKLRESGLDKLFDYIFISDVLGVEKPNVEFFDKVFSEIGDYDKNEILIVGDSLTSDIRGGNNAGILTCRFNPGHLGSDAGVRIDYDIDKLSDVLKIIGKS